MWQQIGQIPAIIIIIFRDSGKYIGEPFLRVYITSLTATQKRVHNGSILGCIMIAAEKITCLPDPQEELKELQCSIPSLEPAKRTM